MPRIRTGREVRKAERRLLRRFFAVMLMLTLAFITLAIAHRVWVG
jgi:hypothetical protein